MNEDATQNDRTTTGLAVRRRKKKKPDVASVDSCVSDLSDSSSYFLCPSDKISKGMWPHMQAFLRTPSGLNSEIT